MCGLCPLQASSTTALWASLWLHREICSVWCPWAEGGWPVPLWASPGLQGAAALCLEHLLPALVPAGLLLPVSYSLLLAAVAQLFPSLTLISQSIPSVAHGSAVAVPSLWSSSWNWLWSDMGQCWALLTEATPAASCYQNLASETQYRTIDLLYRNLPP